MRRGEPVRRIASAPASVPVLPCPNVAGPAAITLLPRGSPFACRLDRAAPPPQVELDERQGQDDAEEQEGDRRAVAEPLRAVELVVDVDDEGLRTAERAAGGLAT